MRARHNNSKSKILWLDLGDFKPLVSSRSPMEQWQDHGLALLRTILQQDAIATDVLSMRNVRSWQHLGRKMAGYKLLLMNVRSYTFPLARQAAEIFKKINPAGLVLVGGVHASVAPGEMAEVKAFDKICQGPGEMIITELVKAPLAGERIIKADGAKSMAQWPIIDRTLWPRLNLNNPLKKNYWPLEPSCGWGPAPIATILTSRVCPWRCAFCNENSFIPTMRRKPVEMVIDELNFLDKNYGPLGSVVIHDSMFMQNPTWLYEWLEKYPRKARKLWPYWAATRTDTIHQWPDLFKALVKETNWQTVSIGFESGSDRVLQLLNKECSTDDNHFTIALLYKLGAEMAQVGKERPQIWTNIMLGIPGERQQDAFASMKMLKTIPQALPSISFYAPYPGSILGHQLIAEGKSLMSKENYHRFPSNKKVKGVDYEFYHDLLEGKYDKQIEAL